MLSVAEPSHFSSAPAPPIKARLRPAPVPKTGFYTKRLKNINFNLKKVQKTKFCPKNGKKLAKKDLLSLKKFI